MRSDAVCSRRTFLLTALVGALAESVDAQVAVGLQEARAEKGGQLAGASADARQAKCQSQD